MVDPDQLRSLLWAFTSAEVASISSIAQIRKAETKLARCERVVDELRPELDQSRQWDADHDWPDSRLRAVNAELTELGSRDQHSELLGTGTSRNAKSD